MIQKVKNILKTRKVKLFFLFLLCSGLAWFINNLSDRYASTTSFEITYVNPPDSMMLVKASKTDIDVKIEAVGFRFLGLQLFKKDLKIDLSTVQKEGSTFFISPQDCKKQLDRQLKGGTRLLETDGDSLLFEFYHVISKKVPVISQLKLDFPQNYLLDGVLNIEPDSVTVKGPKNEVSAIVEIQTAKTELTDLTADFSMQVALVAPSGMQHTTFSDNAVLVKGGVSRFSEKVLSVPVTVVNLPEGVLVQTFPNALDVLVKANLEVLKELKPSDFELVADYDSVSQNNQNVLGVKLVQKPKYIHAANVLKNQVDYILKRE